MKKFYILLSILLSNIISIMCFAHVVVDSTTIDNKLYVYQSCLDIDHFGGTSFKLFFTNGFKKSIKYINFNVSFYNAVNDRIYSKYSHQNYITYEAVGYIESGSKKDYSWDGIYNTTAEYYKLQNVKIIFKDNTTLNLISGKNLIVIQ